MEARLIIFLAFASMTLIANTLMIWFLYKTFARMTTTATQTIRDFENDEATRQWLRTLEQTSTQLVNATSAIKGHVHEFEPVLARAQASFEFGLAMIDARFERVCNSVSDQAEKTQNAIVGPVEKIREAAAGLHGVVEFTERAGRRGGTGQQ